MGLNESNRSMEIITNKLKRLIKDDSQRDFFVREAATSLDEDKSDTKTNFEVMTIHGSKGKEADMIILCNVGSYFEKKRLLLDPDEERRVYYVAATRTKKKLVIAEVDIDWYEESRFLPRV